MVFSAGDGEADLLAKWMIVAAVGTLGACSAVAPPYGRYSRAVIFGIRFPLLDAKLGWILMECPNVLMSLWFLLYGSDETCLKSPVNLALLSMFVLHYVNRCERKRRTYCCQNRGWIQLDPHDPCSPQFRGITSFATVFRVSFPNTRRQANARADDALRRSVREHQQLPAVHSPATFANLPQLLVWRPALHHWRSDFFRRHVHQLSIRRNLEAPSPPGRDRLQDSTRWHVRVRVWRQLLRGVCRVDRVRNRGVVLAGDGVCSLHPLQPRPSSTQAPPLVSRKVSRRLPGRKKGSGSVRVVKRGGKMKGACWWQPNPCL